MKPTKFLLVLILILATVLRIYRIDSFPPLNADEAALGYNAYSLLKTGKDEHGMSWPLHFKSFGDYKPGGYIYLDLPLTLLLGINTLSTRLPNLIFSLCSIYIFYLLINLLSNNKKLSLLSCFLLAISPWHIQFSRGAWEASTAGFLIVLGTYFYLKGLEKSILLIISAIPFVLAMYIYHSSRIVVPILCLSIFLITFKKTLRSVYLKFLIILALLTVPVAISFMANGGSARFGGVGITADPGPIWRANELLNQHPQNNIMTRLLHNKLSTYTISWLEKYINHFSPSFLFFAGDEVQRSKTPNTGQAYLFLAPFFYFGLYKLINSNQKYLKAIILVFIFVSPLPASLTFQAPSALRSLTMVYPLQLVIAYGLIEAISFFQFLKYPVCLLFAYSFIYYLVNYYTLYSITYPFSWPFGFKEMVTFVEKNQDKYNQVYVTDKYDQPYILFLYYLQYNPNLIQNEILLTPKDRFGFSTVEKFGKYNFRKIDWNTVPTNSLVITSDENVQSNPIKLINFPNGGEAFKIYSK